ncbi:MAG TPA: hypothetical protein VK848_07790, partial [Acidimicrobiia bacterium]|nr:hypothetical protein [Acidimicrobiia bacterium]
ETAADGTRASARAAQLTVTIHTGQITVSFGLGYARAGARTIVHEPPAGDGGGPGLGDGLGDLTPSSPGASSAGGSNTGASSAAASSASDSPVAVAPSSSEPLSGNGSDAATGPGGAVLPGGSGTAPVLPVAAPATAVAPRPGGPSKATMALLGVLCAGLLVRYLSYSTKLRRP